MLVGREEELARIDQLLAFARGGTSGVLVLRGEAGIGKSVLLAYAAERAEGMRVLRARGSESESELPFSALHELVLPVLDRIGDIPEPQAVALRGALRLVAASAHDRFAVYAATLSVLAAAAQSRPLLCLVDDMQWIDRDSVEALVFAARRLEAEGVVVLLAERDNGQSSLTASLPQLVLGGLRRKAARALLAAHATVEVAPEVVVQLCEATAGNPLALVELMSVLGDEQLTGDQPLEGPLPAGATIEDAFLLRVRKLAAATQRALLVGAASDSGALDAILAALALTGLPRWAFEPAERAGLVTLEAGRLRFRHPLLRSAIYHAGSPSDRRAAHRALAASASADERAWHLALAAVGPDEDVALLLEEVARGARARGAHSAAATAFERAARLTADVVQRAARWYEAATDAWLGDRIALARRCLQEARVLTTDPLLRADLEQLRARIETWLGRPAHACALLSVEADRIKARDRSRASVLLAQSAFHAILAGDVATAVATARRACTVDLAPSWIAQQALGTALTIHGDLSEARALLVDVQPFVERADPLLAHHLMFQQAQCLTFVGDYGGARRLLERAMAAIRHDGFAGALPSLLTSLCQLDFLTGRWASAYASGLEGVRLAAETRQSTEFPLAILAQLEAALGREGACREHVGECIERALRSGNRGILPWAHAAVGLLELALGRPGEGAGNLWEALRLCEEQGAGGMSEWRAALVEAQVRAGRARVADETRAALDLLAAKHEHPLARACALRCRGLLAADAEFAHQFEAALLWHDRSAVPFERARTELCYGERLRRARRLLDARERLAAALDAFERLDARPWAESARAELRAAGGGASIRARHRPVPAEALTGQELQVALAVASGAKNKEAAAALFLSPKTVDFHLGRVYRKLGIRSRAELARLLAEGPRPPSAASTPEPDRQETDK